MSNHKKDKIIKYNKQQATAALKCLQGTDTLEKYKEKIKAEVLKPIHQIIDEYVNGMDEYEGEDVGYVIVRIADYIGYSTII